MKNSLDLILSEESGQYVTDYAIEKIIDLHGKHYAKAVHLNKSVVYVQLCMNEFGETELKDILDKDEFSQVVSHFTEHATDSST